MSDREIAMNRCSIPSCPHRETGLVFVANDYNRRTTPEKFSYYRCRGCGLIFLSPIPSDLDRYYTSEYYALPSSLEMLENEAVSEYYKIELVKRFLKNGRILDVGAGYGRFVCLAHKAGYEVDAIEVDSDCCKFITNIIGTCAIASAQPEIALAELGLYDAITFWHVIEHLPDPWAVLKSAITKLKKGGFLFVAMPNPESFQLRIFRKYWAHVDAPRHLQLVPLDLLVRELIRDGGMQFLEATTTDQGSLDYNYMGWTGSMRNAIRVRGCWRIGLVLARTLGQFEKIGMHGSCYTAIFQKQ